MPHALSLPCPELLGSYRAMVDEFRAAGEGAAWPHGAVETFMPQATDDFARYLEAHARIAQGRDLPEGIVACTTFWLVLDEDVVGTASLRHELSAALREEGGHLGYCIRPSRRNQGLMRAFAPLLLDAARERGIERLLVTCADTNTASARVIESMGGLLEARFVSKRLHPGELCRRYWVDLAVPRP